MGHNEKNNNIKTIFPLWEFPLWEHPKEMRKQKG